MAEINFNAECHELAKWWLEYAVDQEQGGFWGEVTYDNKPVANADKCIILNARILWFFSEAAAFYNNESYKVAAARAYDYLVSHFYDQEQGGFYWSVDYQGHLKDSRKHIYAQAFCIYALSAFYSLSKNKHALNLAIECFDKIEANGRDPTHGGYFESFDRNWQKSADVRLSEKEDNHPKTMNTHLHVLEAYTGLSSALEASHPSLKKVHAALEHTLKIYCNHIVDLDAGYIKMFLTEDWQDCSMDYSYGHDIESSWLLLKALAALGDNSLYDELSVYAHALAKRSLHYGLQADGRMLDEQNKTSDHTSNTAWWVQVEAMVGFAYMWAKYGNPEYKAAVFEIWQYTLREYKDEQWGEWHWFARSDLPFEQSEYKIGAWKAPYHTGRALMELSKIFS